MSADETTAPDSRRVSFVIPVLDEQETLVSLHERICRVCSQHQIVPEFVFVDDGSTDNSWNVIRNLSETDPRVIAIRFRRNFGKADALDAGFAACCGEIILTMDADLQDDPEEIPRFLDKLDEGFDLVSGWKQVRHDPWHKVFPSRVFNWLVSWMTGVRLHDHNCGFKSYRRAVTADLKLYGERHRFVPVLAAAKGWKVTEIAVEHHRREFGKSKYGVSRLIKGFLDLLTISLLTGFAGRPQHLIGAAGLFCFGTGALGMLYLSTMWVVSRLSDSVEVLHLHQTAIFYYCILLVLLGSQFLLAGLLAELIVSRTQTQPTYCVAERIGDQDENSQ